MVTAAGIAHQCFSQPPCGVCFPSLVSGPLSHTHSHTHTHPPTHTHTHTHTHRTPGQLPLEAPFLLLNECFCLPTEGRRAGHGSGVSLLPAPYRLIKPSWVTSCVLSGCLLQKLQNNLNFQPQTVPQRAVSSELGQNGTHTSAP